MIGQSEDPYGLHASNSVMVRNPGPMIGVEPPWQFALKRCAWAVPTMLFALRPENRGFTGVVDQLGSSKSVEYITPLRRKEG